MLLRQTGVSHDGLGGFELPELCTDPHPQRQVPPTPTEVSLTRLWNESLEWPGREAEVSFREKRIGDKITTREMMIPACQGIGKKCPGSVSDVSI